MKRNEVFTSNYLGQQDVRRPTIAIISHVVLQEIMGERGTEQKAVMHFANDQFKPMILNNINWTCCEDAYGDDSDFWNGKRVEIFVDPNVMFGAKKVGGVRLRIPGNSVNGPPELAWTLAQCVEHCAAVGITREELVAKLKARGPAFASFQMVRDTPVVQAMIAAKSEVPLDPPPSMDSDIPF